MTESNTHRRNALDPAALFGDYMRITNTPKLEPEADPTPGLSGKTLGLINGSSWVSLWATYFGRTILPGVKLVNVGNDAVQLNFMRAHRDGRPVPPQENIDLFVAYAEQLVSLVGVDAMLITCSTMNRSADAVRSAMARHRVPVVQIDEPMMEAAVRRGGRVLVVATHGPTVDNTKALLEETASRLDRSISVVGATVEEAFDLLGSGDVHGHNRHVETAIRRNLSGGGIDSVVLAQLSTSVFLFDHPDTVAGFGVPVYTSGREGFLRVRELLTNE